VARDEKGLILRCWVDGCDPLVAQASALVWALQLAYEKHYQRLILEGDSKTCFDALNGSIDDADWKVQSLLFHALDIANSFVSCEFCWIKRDANFVAHALATHAVLSNSNVFCTSMSLPPLVKEAWERDVFLLLLQ
jgi:ribonuclease HI